MLLGEVVSNLSSARSEFNSLNNSVYKGFVVPPFIGKMDLAMNKHSVALVGGRGSGKSTYLKYFSHWTQFDRNAAGNVKANALEVIILYWKPDTIYCRSMNAKWLSEKNARQFFLVLTGLELLKELMCSLDNICFHFPRIKDDLDSGGAFWKRVSNVLGENLTDIKKITSLIEDQIYDIQVSINANDTTKLINIEPAAVLNYLLAALANDSSNLRNNRFKIFVDEFENLAPYQQRIINNYRKHSSARISWNVAYKRYADVSAETDSLEQIQEGDDYRILILDEQLEDPGWRFFNQEVLLMTLLNSGLVTDIPSLDVTLLRERSRLLERKDPEYQKTVKNFFQRLMPALQVKELARYALNYSYIKKKVTNKFKNDLGLSLNEINNIIDNNPDVAAATWTISNQKSFRADQLKEYIKSDFPANHPYTEKVKTYLYASLLRFNQQYSSYVDIPVYSGIERFSILSANNTRHFFELCYQSLNLMDKDININSVEKLPTLEPEFTHRGAILASRNVVKEVSTFSPYGQSLMSMVNRLGDIFNIFQRSESQSEPEKTHFYVKSDFGKVNDKLAGIIKQAKCWRVLIETDATKDKDPDDSASVEYRLNPIYAPHFGISYRKIRRLELLEKDLDLICMGSAEEYQIIRGKFLQKAKVSSQEVEQGKLFND